MSLRPGDRIEIYEIHSLLGSGGFGEVYRAYDPELERDVAIKVLREEIQEDATWLRRMEREAKLLAATNHPNLAHVYRFGRANGRAYISMELVPGEDLASRLRRGPMSVAEALRLMQQVASGLEAAHDQGVIHRDLKPENVQVTPEGVPKVLDFGHAKRKTPPTGVGSASTEEGPALTAEGAAIGTLDYMSPEQLRGEEVDRAADVWAFGCVLYECLTGRRPFSGNAIEVIHAIEEEAVDLEALPPEVPGRVRDLLSRTFEKDPRSRLRDVREARVALSEGPAEPPRASRTSTDFRRNLGLAGVALTVVVLSSLWVWRRSVGSAPPSPPLVTRVPLEFRFAPSEDVLQRIAGDVEGGLLPKISGFVLADREPARLAEVRVYHDTAAWRLRNGYAGLAFSVLLGERNGPDPVQGGWSYYQLPDPSLLRRLLLEGVPRTIEVPDPRPGTTLLGLIGPQDYHPEVKKHLAAGFGHSLDLQPRVIVAVTRTRWTYRRDPDAWLDLDIVSSGASLWASGTSAYLDRTFESLSEVPFREEHEEDDGEASWKRLAIEARSTAGESWGPLDLSELRSKYSLDDAVTATTVYHEAVDRLLGYED